MDAPAFIQAIHDSALSEWLRTTLRILPVIEAIHVMAIATVFGSIFIVDLRLLGVPNARRSYTRTAGELLPWTWAAFAVAVVTGLLMFAPNAATYWVNVAFRVKMLVILCAGVNMAIFQLVTVKSVAAWDTDAPAPLAARVAGALSMTFWTTVIICGRIIGFTKARDFGNPEDLDIDFDFSLLTDGVGALVAAVSSGAPQAYKDLFM